ncbi:MAG: ABC transporter permease [Christensenellales bacterium]
MRDDLKSIIQNNGISRYFKSNAGILIGLLLLCTFFTINTSTFLTQNNLLNVLRQISMNAIVAVGMSYTILVVGVDLTIGATVGATGCLTVIMFVNGIPLAICFLCSIVMGLIIGACNGLLISFIKMPAFIATLAMQTVVRGVAYAITEGKPTRFDNEFFYSIGNGYLGPIPIPVIIMFVIIIIASLVLNKTRFGRRMYAVGGNKEAALFSGINNNRVIISVYLISGALAALTGIVMASRLSSGQPIAGEGMEPDAIAAAVLGGTSFSGGIGKIGGTLIGALIIGVLNNGLNLMQVPFFWQYIVKGLVIILAIALDIAKKQNMFTKKKIIKEVS